MSRSSLVSSAQLPNPFLMSDSEILEKVYLSHTYDDEAFDKQIVFNVVSSVISRSTEIVDTLVFKKESRAGFIESRAAITDIKFKPEFSTLKLLSCQMITIPSGVDYAHQTTLRILQQLRTFSWDAKALIALAAFALEYGNFWYLHQIPTSDQLGNALRQLNQVQNRQFSIIDINNLVKLVAEVVQETRVWATWADKGYDTEDVPALSEALQGIPVVVYWAIASIVASTGNLIGVSEYKLSEFYGRLLPVLNKLKKDLEDSKAQIDEIEDYNRRKRAFRNPKDVVDFLKILIRRNGSLNAQVYDGSTQNKVGIEVFKQKHVLLFISSLYSIEDEIRLLNSIYERLQEDPKEVKGLNKDDFKILWIPIVDSWDAPRKELFRNLKSDVKWYVVEYSSPLPGVRLIREDLNYANKPIIPVVNPQGKVINKDAMSMIFEWGIDAFPFGENDGDLLVQKWKWFWDEMKKTIPTKQIKGDRYIFIYGGNDNNWIQAFALEVEKIKRHEIIKSADAIIDHYQVGKNDPNIVTRFWIGIESKKQKKHSEASDCEIQGIINSLLCLKKDPKGWALLSKGFNIKILGHGDPMYQTVAEFDLWKDNVLEKEGFDIAFKEYYENKVKTLPAAPQPCAYMNIDNYTSTPNVVATITCPNPTCGRVMEVTSVNYRCCHSDVPSSGKISFQGKEDISTKVPSA